jgi:two-component system chemotaxis response regulator CheY
MKKILIVDDSIPLRQQLRKDLEEAGYSVVEAADGAIGLSRLEQNPDVALIIGDVNMPNMGGMAMFDAIRQNAVWNAKPRFMLTTEFSRDMKAKGKELGLNLWVVKPYQKDTLLAAIEETIGK